MNPACSARAALRSGSAAVHPGLRERRKLLARRLFLIEVLFEQGRAIVASELPCPGDQAAVARDLVVLDGLRCSDQGGVQDALVLDLAGNLIGFLDDAVDSGLVEQLETCSTRVTWFLVSPAARRAQPTCASRVEPVEERC
jgi:hypothetical protein